ncbi:MAG: Rieske 2Fe-2S domain-containing protein [bacterium]|nr:Rieske 2Fe-2S domain-containing protein [bacterium]
MEKENYNRRDFLKTSLKTIAIGSLALSTIDIKKLMAEADADTASKITKVINVADYPALGSVGGNADIGKAMVFRAGESKFTTISTVCTHKKCDVEFNGSDFECPCHGSTFTKSGKVTNGPATKNLKSYKTKYNAADNTLNISM